MPVHSQRLRNGLQQPNAAALVKRDRPKQFALGIPTLNRYDLLDKCLDAVALQSCKPRVVLLVDNGGKFVQKPGFDIEFVRIETEQNEGVSGSWTIASAFAWQMGLDSIVLLNDDTQPAPNTFERLYSYDEGLVVCGNHMNAFSCFRLDRWVYDELGPFDLQLWPAYMEDNDYSRRALVNGVPIRVAQGIEIQHVGTATLHAMPNEGKQDFLREPMRRDYYLRKWGGGPRRELFEVPFDGTS